MTLLQGRDHLVVEVKLVNPVSILRLSFRIPEDDFTGRLDNVDNIWNSIQFLSLHIKIDAVLFKMGTEKIDKKYQGAGTNACLRNILKPLKLSFRHRIRE